MDDTRHRTQRFSHTDGGGRSITRTAQRTQFLDATELASLRFVYRRKRGSTRAPLSQSFSFGLDGFCDGHPMQTETSTVQWPYRIAWRFSHQQHAVEMGPPDTPFPCLYASREADWSWRLENRNVILTEWLAGVSTAAASSETQEGGDYGESAELLPPPRAMAEMEVLEMQYNLPAPGHEEDFGSDVLAERNIIVVAAGGGEDDLYYQEADDLEDTGWLGVLDDVMLG